MSTALHAYRWFRIPGYRDAHIVDDVPLAPLPLCGIPARRNVTWRPADPEMGQCERCRDLLLKTAEGRRR